MLPAPRPNTAVIKRRSVDLTHCGVLTLRVLTDSLQRKLTKAQNERTLYDDVLLSRSL
jgi:hypothetical protein